MSNLRIDELLKNCTVKLSVSENGQVGTGFLIAPGYILTCEHVVRGAAAATVGYKNNEDYTTATVEQVFADSDVALLQFEPPQELPCVLLNTRVPEVGCKISTFGYPYRYEDDGTPWKGIPALLTMEGTTGDEPPYLQLSLGNVLPGMSGGALLDRKKGQVCGMLKFTRDEHSVMGGGGVMSSTIAQCIPEILETQRRFHERNSLWREAKPLQPIVENLPQNKAQAFKGREKALGDLHTQVENGGAVAIMSIRGMGGVGKTELALQYADRYRDSYPGGICWLAARESNVGTGLVQYAKARLGLTPPDDVDLSQQVAYCWQQWPGDGDVLVVYDDVTDYRLIEEYLPLRHGRRFRVLLTTRVQNVATTVTDFPLETLMPAAALELLQAIVGVERIDAERQIAEALCERVGYLPLGLELLGYFLKNKPSMSLEKLQQRLEKNRLNAKAFKAAHPGMTAKLGVIDAFELSWEELSEAGQELACWLSLFALAPIPWELAVAVTEKNKHDELEDIRDEELLKLSLTEQLSPDFYQLHQLLREFFLAKLEERKRRQNLIRKYYISMILIANSTPYVLTVRDIDSLEKIIPHMKQVKNYWKQAVPEISVEQALCPLILISHFYQVKNMYSEAEKWFEIHLKLTTENINESNPIFINQLSRFGSLHRDKGDYRKAEEIYTKSLNLARNNLAESDINSAIIANNLADLYRLEKNSEKYDYAENLYLESLEKLNRINDNQNLPYIATLINNLALITDLKGDFKKARYLLVKALKIRVKTLGFKHIDVAVNLNNLASIYDSLGQYKKAENRYLKSLKISFSIRGFYHEDVSRILNNLGLNYIYQARYPEAEKCLLDAIKIENNIFDFNHPRRSIALRNIANLYRDNGIIADAEKFYLEAFIIYLGVPKFKEEELFKSILEDFLRLIVFSLTSKQTHSLSKHTITQGLVNQVLDLID